MSENNIKNSIKNNFEYRNYLTKHGNKIMIENTKIALANGNFDINNVNLQNNLLTNSPFLYNNITQDTKPNGYTESDLKNNFINKEISNYQLNSLKLVEPLQYKFNI